VQALRYYEELGLLMPTAVSAAIACAEVLDQLPPVIVFALEDQTLLLVDGSHGVAAAQQAGRTTQPVERSRSDSSGAPQ
jgi:hypothetical protein